MRTIHDTDALIGKFLAGEASPDEAMLLEDWKNESAENRSYFNECERILGLPKAEASPDQAWKKVKPKLQHETPVRKLRPVFLRIAASIVVLAGVGTLLVYFLGNGTVEMQVFTALNTEKQVELTDGTSVVIAKHSSIELAENYGTKNRSVNLKGSGYFTVDHDEKLPFIVNAGPLHIKDLGTKFDVNTTKDTIFIRVDEGEVLIYDNSGTTITLKANESAHYVISTKTLEIAVETTGKPNATKVFVFKDRRLSDVVEALKVAYQADIRIKSPQAGNCLITINFSDEDLELALDVIAETLGLTVERTAGSYILAGESCAH